MKPLLSGQARNKRLGKVISLAYGDVLDIGCGHTRLPDKLSGVTSYSGIDVSDKAVEQCQRRYPEYEFHCLNLDQDSLPTFGRHFDTVIMTAIIEHLHQPSRVLCSIRPLLKDDGRLLITTPSPLGDVAHQIGSRIKLFYPESVVGHVKIFSRMELCALLVDCGFEVELYERFLLGLNQLVVGRPAS